ncbi:MAG: DUF4846 domain-containing protein, partial [Candidatus Wallbacteria bacterium]|nr:DUF4846 domain-containing protein [Candidatus Wallbacteria bacterium]
RCRANDTSFLDFLWPYVKSCRDKSPACLSSVREFLPGDLISGDGPDRTTVVAVDMAEHPVDGSLLFLFACNKVPNQELTIISNPSNTRLSPLFELRAGRNIVNIPECSLSHQNMRRIWHDPQPRSRKYLEWSSDK